MTFKWIINRPAFQANVQGVEVMHAGISVEFETGSIGEAHGIFSDNGTALSETFGPLLAGNTSQLATDIGGSEAQGEQTKERKERKRRNNGADPSTAAAPPPVTIPGVEALDEAAAGAAAAAAIAAPPALPAPPAAPPTGILAGKITGDLERRAAASPDQGQGLADWLATSGIVVKGATFAEALEVLRLQSDEKLKPIADALKIA